MQKNSKIKVLKEWLKKAGIMKSKGLWETATARLIGHYSYYGVSYNLTGIKRSAGAVKSSCISGSIDMAKAAYFLNPCKNLPNVFTALLIVSSSGTGIFRKLLPVSLSFSIKEDMTACGELPSEIVWLNFSRNEMPVLSKLLRSWAAGISGLLLSVDNGYSLRGVSVDKGS